MCVKDREGERKGAEGGWDKKGGVEEGGKRVIGVGREGEEGGKGRERRREGEEEGGRERRREGEEEGGREG